MTEAGELSNDSEDRYIERTLAAVLGKEAALGRLHLERFDMRPQFIGASGSTGIRYGRRRDHVRAVVLHKLEAMLAALASRKQV
jgi:hypothetical protein